MLEIILSLCLMSGTWLTLKDGWTDPRGFRIAGFDINALGLAALAVIAAWYFWGPMYGMALIVAVIIHEFGHVAAFRVCGHADATFRLVPLMGGYAISKTIPSSGDKSFFITLMGPAICLAPMVLCFALAELIYVKATSEPVFLAANFLTVLGTVLGSLNFFNLLPLWPLDGGKLTQRLVYTFAPALTHHASIAMAVFAAALCVITRQYLLLFFVVSSWQGLLQSETLLGMQSKLPRRTAWIALLAYLATAAAFFMGGGALLASLF